MNFKNATLWGILLWIFIFVEVSILMFTPFIASRMGLYYILYYLILALLFGYCAYSYFKIQKKSNWKEGLYLGLWFILVGSILDLIITVPLFVKDFSFFYDPLLLIGFVENLVVCMIVGYYLNKKK